MTEKNESIMSEKNREGKERDNKGYQNLSDYKNTSLTDSRLCHSKVSSLLLDSYIKRTQKCRSTTRTTKKQSNLESKSYKGQHISKNKTSTFEENQGYYRTNLQNTWRERLTC